MRILDEKHRLFGVVNPIDLAVLVALVIIAFVAVRVLFGTTPVAVKRETRPVEVTVVASRVRSVDAAQFKKGDVVRKKDGRPVGRLETFTIEPMKIEVPKPDGTVAVEDSPLFSEVTLVCRGQGEPTDEGVMIDGAKVRQNMALAVATPLFESGEGRIAELRFLDE